MPASTPRGDGDLLFCVECGDPVRRVAVLAAATDIERCPTCFEALLTHD